MKTLFFLIITTIYLQTTLAERNLYNTTLFQFKMNNSIIENKKFVSEQCANQLTESFTNGAWIKMLDASSKSIDGLLVGNFFSLGNFDECYNIATVTNPKEILYGKYCIGSIPLALTGLRSKELSKDPFAIIHPSRQLGREEETTGFHFAICLPSACNATDATKFTANIIQFTENFCYSIDTAPELTWGAIVTIIILGIFLTIIVISTIFDIVLFYKKLKTTHEIFIAFSVLSNGKKLITSAKNPNQLLCLNGIKAISMMWVIIGHEYSNSFTSPLSNFLDVITWEHDPANMFLLGATVSVDTFFMVGGLVTVYTFLKASDNGIKLNVPLYYLHRYIRLTPALGAIMAIHATLIIYFGNGPLWNTINESLADPCRSYWWTNLLYIQNYYIKTGVCVPQSWYLATDMQLFILSPIVLLPLIKWPKLTLYLLFSLVFTSCIIDFTIGYVYELPALFSDTTLQSNFTTIYYLPTHTRYGPYVIGMIFGYYIYKYKTGKKIITLTIFQALLLWLVLLTSLVACVYGGHDNIVDEYNVWKSSLYLAFNRQAWAIAVGGVVYLCVTGYGGPINAFLSHAIFQFFTKLSYSIYLVHFSLIMMRNSTTKVPIRFSNYQMMFNFWGDFAFTLVLSLILCLTFESPLIIIEKYLFGRKHQKRSREKKPPV